MLNLAGIYPHVRQARKTEMSKIEVGLNIWWSVNWDEETMRAIEGARRLDFIVYA